MTMSPMIWILISTTATFTYGNHLFIGNNPISRMYSVSLPDGNYIFEPQSRIYKSGWIKRWEVYFSSRQGSVSFQIWRQITSPLEGASAERRYGPTRYQLVGETVTKSASYVGFHIFQSEAQTADQRFWVSAGDVIGIRMIGGNPIPYSTSEDSCWASNQFLYTNMTSLPVGQSHDFLEGSSHFQEPCRKYSVRALVEFGGGDEGDTEDCLVMKADTSPAILTSPGYPKKYPRDLNMCWVLQSRFSFERIRIDLESSNLQRTPRNQSCFLTDYVTIRDGPTSDSSLLGGWCGGSTPERGTIMSTNPIVFIRFYSDDSVEGSGFKLLYYSTKGEEIVLTRSWLRGERLIMFAAGMTMLVTVTFAVSGFSYTRYRSKPSLGMRKRKRNLSSKGGRTGNDLDTDKLLPSVSEEVEMPSGLSDTATMFAYNEVVVHPSPPFNPKIIHQMGRQANGSSAGGATGGTDNLAGKSTNFPARKCRTVCGAEGGVSRDECLVYSDRKYHSLNVDRLTINRRNTDSELDHPSMSFF